LSFFLQVALVRSSFLSSRLPFETKIGLKTYFNRSWAAPLLVKPRIVERLPRGRLLVSFVGRLTLVHLRS